MTAQLPLRAPSQPAAEDVEFRRLLWRSRRGMKELDVVLERYVRSQLPHASPEVRRVLTDLLELPDPVLADYLFGHATAAEPAVAAVIAAIRGESAPERPSSWDNIHGMPEL